MRFAELRQARIPGDPGSQNPNIFPAFAALFRPKMGIMLYITVDKLWILWISGFTVPLFLWITFCIPMWNLQ